MRKAKMRLACGNLDGLGSVRTRISLTGITIIGTRAAAADLVSNETII
jgi:hypothetical protein